MLKSVCAFIQKIAPNPTVLCPAIFLGLISTASIADESDARQLLKAMSDYLDSQTAYSFDYDSVLEVVTVDGQVLGVASSGHFAINRPDRIYASRHGGFADVEMSFDGKTLTVFGKNANQYTQVDIPGDTDNLIDQMKNVYNVPLPAADLILSNASKILLEGVTDVKDLGSGVIEGVECDSLAFRTEEVDWQIWIAQGDKPYPCRYVITSKQVTNAPQYAVQTRNWKMGAEVPRRDFTFRNTTNAAKVELDNLSGAGSLPDNFTPANGESQ